MVDTDHPVQVIRFVLCQSIGRVVNHRGRHQADKGKKADPLDSNWPRLEPRQELGNLQPRSLRIGMHHLLTSHRSSVHNLLKKRSPVGKLGAPVTPATRGPSRVGNSTMAILFFRARIVIWYSMV